MGAPALQTSDDHPLAEAARRAARAAAVRAKLVAAHRIRLGDGGATTVADLAAATTYLAEAQCRSHEARRRLVTHQLARAYQNALGQDFFVAARRLARLTLAEDVRGRPLDL